MHHELATSLSTETRAVLRTILNRNMDDGLEQPTVSMGERREEDEDAQSSGDEDEGPDWTKLPYVRV